jgi:hypothetical protein
VLLFCPKCQYGVRTRSKPNATGQKERHCVKCASSLGVIGAKKKKKKAAPVATGQGS